jgi:RimJ/RimL family protein N-acetyltransferase
VSFALRPASQAHFDRLIADEAPEAGVALPATPLADKAVLVMLAGIAARVETVFAPSAWMIVEEPRVVGLLSLTTEPDGTTATIGYGIAPSEEGRGAASEAVAALVAWARGDGRLAALSAETRTDNIASQRVLEKNGFARTAERDDPEDGALYCWRCEL